MRRLTRHQDDSGAVTLFIVIAMPVLLLFAALTFDGARGFVAERETQNSADAAALAMAMDCSKASAACADGVADATAAGYQRGSTLVPGSTGCVAGVGTGTCTATMHQTIGFRFGTGSGNVDRPATAEWGTIGSMVSPTPLTISSCEYSSAILTATNDIYLHMGGNFTPPAGCTGVAGSPPGGFGWLDDTDCKVPTSAGGTVPSQPGNSGNESCVIPLLGKEIVVPIYNAYSGSGSGATYTIMGYATFKLTGYSFNGSDFDGLGMKKKCPLGNGSTSCIRGDFVSFSTQQGTLGPSPDMGSYRVYLSS